MRTYNQALLRNRNKRSLAQILMEKTTKRRDLKWGAAEVGLYIAYYFGQ